MTSDPTVGIFQVDAYTPRTNAQVNTVRANSARSWLPYRFDGPNARLLSTYYKRGTYQSLWGRSKIEFVTVKLSDVRRAGSLRAAIDAKTRTVPNLGGAIGVGMTYVTAWQLPAGATTKAPWTPRPDLKAATSQREWDAVVLPRSTTTQVKVQTGTRQVTNMVWKDVPATGDVITYVPRSVTRTVQRANPIPAAQTRVYTQWSVN